VTETRAALAATAEGQAGLVVAQDALPVPANPIVATVPAVLLAVATRATAPPGMPAAPVTVLEVAAAHVIQPEHRAPVGLGPALAPSAAAGPRAATGPLELTARGGARVARVVPRTRLSGTGDGVSTRPTFTAKRSWLPSRPSSSRLPNSCSAAASPPYARRSRSSATRR
jgi:hypothetical protein